MTAPTPAQVLARAERYLERHGVEAPRSAAEVLLAHALGTDRAGIYARTRPLDPDEARSFGRSLCLRCEGTPVQHVTREQPFRHLVLEVRPGVFIPRPETEVLVEIALAAIADVPSPSVVDVCTGTGAIALAIAAERPDARVIAIDRSPAAVELARDNARRLGIDVTVLEGDLLAPLPIDLVGDCDLVVSNPPYVRPEDFDALPADVRAEPYEALVGDLELLRRLLEGARGALRPGGSIVLEIGEGQAAETLGELAGFAEGRTHHDLAGRDRIVSARRT